MKRWFVVLVLVALSGCDVKDCKDNPEIAGVCVDVTQPVINGITNDAIALNEDFDPFQNITAVDDMNGDITSKMTIKGEVDTSSYGQYLLTYTVEDQSGNKTIALRYITVLPDASVLGGNLVENGSFEQGFDGFSTLTELVGGDATFQVVDGVLEVNVLNTVTTIPWEPRLEYQGLEYYDGITYEVSFDVWAEEPRMIEVLIGELINYDPWFINYSPNHQARIMVDTDVQTISFMFTMNTTTDNGCIIFHFGEMGVLNMLTTVYIDNIEIRPIQ